MLRRLSVNVLVKSVIAAMAAMAVLLLSMNAWESWQRLGATSRIAAIADVSGYLFRAMDKLRTDRSFTGRGLDAAGPIDAGARKPIEESRAGEIPALQSAVDKLAGIDFPDHERMYADLQRLHRTVLALITESAAALDKPKTERRESLGKEFVTAESELIDLLEKLQDRLTSGVKLQDPLVDQMMEIKQLAWTVRFSAGDIAVLVSNGLVSGHVAPDAAETYAALLSRIDTAWAALQDVGFGTTLPPALVQAINATKSSFFAPDFTATRKRLLNQVLAGEKPEMTFAEWAPQTLPRVSSLVPVAEAALDAAREHSLSERDAAVRELGMQLAFLAGALALALGSMLAIGRYVIRPLHTIRDAMLKVAGGDLTAEVSFLDRQDEIGALAGALGTFKQNASEKARIEEEQRQRRAQAEARQQAVEAHIKEFEGQMKAALAALGTASAEMSSTSDGISRTAEKSDHQVKAVTTASMEASSSVQTVAAAAEQLSASIAEISQQVTQASSIAGRAVEETRQTDSTVQTLSETASKIGEVVKLISDIAGQTNLLALNATIEAARAGEAGKGFAVVASEVKSLATQTAKATEDISEQIVAVQKVTGDAVGAIKRIGGTISEVSSVATSIAAAMEEQGAATQEITRSTQQAAQRTKDVSENIVGVAAGADETGTAAQGVKSAAEALGARAEQLRDQVNDFLAKIRAA